MSYNTIAENPAPPEMDVSNSPKFMGERHNHKFQLVNLLEFSEPSTLWGAAAQLSRFFRLGKIYQDTSMG